jgi:hypothetical protein
MASSVTVTHYGIEATGRNVTEAKRSAGREIERIVKNLYPRIYCYRGYSVVIYPTTCGFAYSIVGPDREGWQAGASMCPGSRDDATNRAVCHLLDITRRIGEYDIPEWARGLIDDEQQTLADWRSNDAWQRAYRHAESIGETDPHSWACHNSRQDQFQSAA